MAENTGNMPAEKPAETSAAPVKEKSNRKKEYTVLCDILNSGKLIKAGTKGALKQLSDKTVAEFVESKVLE